MYLHTATFGCADGVIGRGEATAHVQASGCGGRSQLFLPTWRVSGVNRGGQAQVASSFPHWDLLPPWKSDVSKIHLEDSLGSSTSDCARLLLCCVSQKGKKRFFWCFLLSRYFSDIRFDTELLYHVLLTLCSHVWLLDLSLGVWYVKEKSES